ncbi:MAG: M20/M25/M40 family metallo-hydrolase [Caldilineaceae bacterium]|nr:M20/M25/M40 family metallo-hydrolase [Caldilineaceae bacterium]
MAIDVVSLTQELVKIDSVSRHSNVVVTTVLAEQLARVGFGVEWLEFVDDHGERKASLVAKKGSGTGGLAFFSHSDTVPGDSWAAEAWTPCIEQGRLIGLGSCDMKGPLAATMAAAAAIDVNRLKKPVYIVITADEEITGRGAKQVAEESTLFTASAPEHGVIAEPTRLIPVYAHKGGASVIVTAQGRAAHTSTDQGISANFLIAPFLAEVAALASQIKTDPAYMNAAFQPPTNGFNMVLNDGDCKANVTAAKSVCTLSFRPMPQDHSEELIALLTAKAQSYGFAVSSGLTPPFYVDPTAPVIQIALRATGVEQAATVAFGTDSVSFRHYVPLVILGPGDIAQAHTVGEWIDLAQLHAAVDVYQRMINICCQ